MKKIGRSTLFAPRVVSWGNISVTRYDTFSVGTNFSTWRLFSDDGGNDGRRKGLKD